MLKCESIKSFDGTITSILLFGLIHKVRPYTENAAKQAIENGLYFYCSTEDENGNIYKLYSDYDPVLEITKTIAFIIK